MAIGVSNDEIWLAVDFGFWVKNKNYIITGASFFLDGIGLVTTDTYSKENNQLRVVIYESTSYMRVYHTSASFDLTFA